MSSKTQLNQRLDGFLRKVQNKAFAIAMISVKNRNDALDAVQNAMLAFVDKYKHKPDDQWTPLFYRILQNKVKDHHRKNNRWHKLFFASKENDENALDPIDTSYSDDLSPFDQLNVSMTGKHVIEAISQLSEQQKQTVIYRLCHDMSVEETAQIMQISQGSIKTHLFRALKHIRQHLGEIYE